jgi:hypothetical protein
MNKGIKYLFISGFIFISILGLILIIIPENKNNNRNIIDLINKFSQNLNGTVNDYSIEYYEKNFSFKKEETNYFEIDNINKLNEINVSLISINFKVILTNENKSYAKTNVIYYAKSEQDYLKYLNYYNREIILKENNLKIDYSIKDKNINLSNKLVIIGDIALYLSSKLNVDSLNIENISGSCKIENVKIYKIVDLSTVSGDLIFDSIACRDLNIKNSKFSTVSGDINLLIKGDNNLKNYNTIIETNSGKIEYGQKVLKNINSKIIVNENVNEKTINIKSVSGDIYINSINE